jgi:hypothetical protein
MFHKKCLAIEHKQVTKGFEPNFYQSKFALQNIT